MALRVMKPNQPESVAMAHIIVVQLFLSLPAKEITLPRNRFSRGQFHHGSGKRKSQVAEFAPPGTMVEAGLLSYL
jgi:hypothetical protein